MDINTYFESIGVLGIISLIVQIYAAIHAFKRRNIFWGILSLIFIFSAVFYLILYIIPEWRGKKPMGMMGMGAGNDFDIKKHEVKLQNKYNPKEEVERLEELVKESDTVANIRKLGDVYMELQEYEKAYANYTKCLKGVFKDDAYILLDAAKAAYKAKKYNESIEHIQLILDNTPKFPDQTYWFVLAKNYEAINLPEKALEIYQKHICDIRGEEAKFNYATLLFQLGKNDEGAEVANTIVKDVSKGTPMYKAEQALWMEEAKKLLDKMGKSHTLKLNDDRS